MMHQEHHGVGRGDDDLEQVDLEERLGRTFRAQPDDLMPVSGRDGQQIHDAFSVPGR